MEGVSRSYYLLHDSLTFCKSLCTETTENLEDATSDYEYLLYEIPEAQEILVEDEEIYSKLYHELAEFSRFIQDHSGKESPQELRRDLTISVKYKDRLTN